MANSNKKNMTDEEKELGIAEYYFPGWLSGKERKKYKGLHDIIATLVVLIYHDYK